MANSNNSITTKLDVGVAKHHTRLLLVGGVNTINKFDGAIGNPPSCAELICKARDLDHVNT